MYFKVNVDEFNLVYSVCIVSHEDLTQVLINKLLKVYKKKLVLKKLFLLLINSLFLSFSKYGFTVKQTLKRQKRRKKGVKA